MDTIDTMDTMDDLKKAIRNFREIAIKLGEDFSKANDMLEDIKKNNPNIKDKLEYGMRFYYPFDDVDFSEESENVKKWVDNFRNVLTDDFIKNYHFIWNIVELTREKIELSEGDFSTVFIGVKNTL